MSINIEPLPPSWFARMRATLWPTDPALRARWIQALTLVSMVICTITVMWSLTAQNRELKTLLKEAHKAALHVSNFTTKLETVWEQADAAKKKAAGQPPPVNQNVRRDRLQQAMARRLGMTNEKIEAVMAGQEDTAMETHP